MTSLHRHLTGKFVTPQQVGRKLLETFVSCLAFLIHVKYKMQNIKIYIHLVTIIVFCQIKLRDFRKSQKKTNPYNLNSKTVKLLPNRSEGGIYWGLFYMGDPQPPCSLVLLSLLILLMPSGHQINNALPSSTLLFYVFLCFTPLFSALLCISLLHYPLFYSARPTRSPFRWKPRDSEGLDY